MNIAPRLLTSIGLGLILAGCSAGQGRETSVAAAQAREAHACAGITEQVHQSNPLYRRELISHVTPLYREERHGKVTFQRVRGAEVHVRATPSTTAQWLQRSLSCHVARRELGQVRHADVPNDPLWLPSGPASVSVRESADGFVVMIEGRDHGHGQEVLSRAQALLEPTSSGYAGNGPVNP